MAMVMLGVKILNISDWTLHLCSTLIANFTSALTLKTNEPNLLREMMISIVNKPFLLHEAQMFPRYVIYNS